MVIIIWRLNEWASLSHKYKIDSNFVLSALHRSLARASVSVHDNGVSFKLWFPQKDWKKADKIQNCLREAPGIAVRSFFGSICENVFTLRALCSSFTEKLLFSLSFVN